MRRPPSLSESYIYTAEYKFISDKLEPLSNKAATEPDSTSINVIERVVEKPAASQPAQVQPKKEEESW